MALFLSNKKNGENFPIDNFYCLDVHRDCSFAGTDFRRKGRGDCYCGGEENRW